MNNKLQDTSLLDCFWETKKNLCLESGAKDEVFLEFDSFLTNFLDQTLDTRIGIPFLHVIHSAERFLRMMKVERNIKLRFIYFHAFECIWESKAAILLRKILLNHVKNKLFIRVDEFEAPWDNNFLRYLKIERPYVVIGSLENHEDIPFVTNWHLMDLFMINVTNYEFTEFVTFSGLIFHSNTISGFVWKKLKNIPKNKKKIIPNILSLPKLKKPVVPKIEVDIIKEVYELMNDGLECKEDRVDLKFAAMVSAVLIKLNLKYNFKIFNQLLLHTLKIQDSLSLRERCCDLIIPKRIIEDLSPRLRVFFEVSHNFITSIESILGVNLCSDKMIDFLDCRLFAIVYMLYEKRKFTPEKILFKENFSSVGIHFTKIEDTFKKRRKIDPVESEEEEDDDVEEDYFDEELSSADVLHSPVCDFDDFIAEEMKENKVTLLKINNRVIDGLMPHLKGRVIKGDRIVEKEELEEEEEDGEDNVNTPNEEVFMDDSHWRVDQKLDGKKVGYYARKRKDEWLNFISRGLEVSKLKFSDFVDTRNRVKRIQKSLKEEKWGEELRDMFIPCFPPSNFEREEPSINKMMEIAEKMYIDWEKGEEILELEEALIYCYIRKILTILNDNKNLDNEKLWRFYHRYTTLKKILFFYNEKKKVFKAKKYDNNNNNKIGKNRQKGKKGKKKGMKDNEESKLNILIQKVLNWMRVDGEMPSVYGIREINKKMDEKDNIFRRIKDIRYQLQNREDYEVIEEVTRLNKLEDFWNRKDYNDYKKRYGFIPDLWQKKLMNYVDEEKSVVVVTPTSTGKTFMVFYLIDKILRKQGICVFVSPTNSLVQQMARDVYTHFRGRPTGKDMSLVGVFTSDDKVSVLNSHILVTNSECLHILMLSPNKAGVEWRKKLHYVCFDEIHTIGDWGNGKTWERLLLMVDCPVLCLSATIGNAKQFYQWLCLTKTIKSKSSKNKKNKKEIQQKKIKNKNNKKNDIFDNPNIEFIMNNVRPNDLKYHYFDNNKNIIKSIHPCSLLNTITENPKLRKNEISWTKKMTPSQCLQLYNILLKEIVRKIGDEDEEEEGESENEEEENEILRRIKKLSPEKYFSEYNWDELINRNPREHDTRKTVLSYEKELRSIMEYLSQEMQDVYRSVVSISEIKNDFLEPDEDLKLKHVLPDLILNLKSRNLFPTLVFHFDRFQVENLGKSLYIYLQKKKLTLYEEIKIEDIDDEEEEEEEEEKKKNPKKSEEKEEKEGEIDEETKKKRAQELRQKRMEEEKKKQRKKMLKKIKLERKKRAERERANAIHKAIHQIREDRRKDPHYKGKLDKNEDTLLLKMLLKGIGVHHGQLDKSYRVTIERLFREKKLRVVICTGTLSYGINMPARSVCIFGDSIYLTPTLFNQTTGRSGRRGYDVVGNIVLFDLSPERIRRLMVGENNYILGNITIDPTYVLRLMIAMSSSDDISKRSILSSIRRLLTYPLSCIQNMNDLKFLENSKRSLFHHFRFAIEFLMEKKYLNQEAGLPINYAGMASHLFYTAPSNFLFIEFIKKSLFSEMLEGYESKLTKLKDVAYEKIKEERRIARDYNSNYYNNRIKEFKNNRFQLKKIKKEKEMELRKIEKAITDDDIFSRIDQLALKNLRTGVKLRMMSVLCFIFTGIECRRNYRGEEKVTLDPLESKFQNEVLNFGRSVYSIFLRYVKNLPFLLEKKKKKKKKNDNNNSNEISKNTLPLSGIYFGQQEKEKEKSSNYQNIKMFLEKNRMEMNICSLFCGLSGNADQKFEKFSIPSILSMMDKDSVFFDPSLFPIPYSLLPRDSDINNINDCEITMKVSSLIFDFFVKKKKIKELSRIHRFSNHTIIYHLNLFRKKIQKIHLSLEQLSSTYSNSTGVLFVDFLKEILDDFNALYFGNYWKVKQLNKKMADLRKFERRAKRRDKFKGLGDINSGEFSSKTRDAVLDFAHSSKSKKWRSGDF